MDEKIKVLEQEIKECKKLLKRLRESENHFKLLLDTMPEQFALYDKDFRILFTNKYSKKIGKRVGRKINENFLGRHCYEAWHNRNKICENCSVNKAMQTGEVQRQEITTPDGRTHLIHGVALFDKKGNVTGAAEYSKDITASKKIKNKLQEDQELYSSIIESMNDGILVLDKNFEYTHWNRAMEKISGMPREKLLGKGKVPWDIFPSLVKEGIDKMMKQAMQGHIVQRENIVHILPDSTKKYTSEVYFPLKGKKGIIRGVVGVIRDVTEKMCMEEMMIQNEKMLSVGGLAAGMAHEINNPMAGMMQTASVLASRLTTNNIVANLKAAEKAGTTMEAIKKYMEIREIPRMINTINDSGRRVAEIVDNMLGFARKSDAIISSHDLSELLDNVIELASTDYDLKKQYDFKAIEIIKNYEQNLPLVPCEGSKIQQVMLNILRNGAQAMHEQKGENNKDIFKPKFTLKLFTEMDTGSICLEIEDNGPGMGEDIRKRIFDPFFTTKPIGVGTGLGLSVSYFIITENHRGSIDVISEIGKGTKFIIRLPLEGGEKTMEKHEQI